MWAGAPCGDQLVANSPREGQVSESSVQMSELAAPDSELNSAEAVVVDGHPFPGGDLSDHGLVRRGAAYRLARDLFRAHTCHHPAVLVIHHLLLSKALVFTHLQRRSSSALEVKGKIH
jgi:hypothetical protein